LAHLSHHQAFTFTLTQNQIFSFTIGITVYSFNLILTAHVNNTPQYCKTLGIPIVKENIWICVKVKVKAWWWLKWVETCSLYISQLDKKWCIRLN